MRTQFWQPITPVDGQTIPYGAEWSHDGSEGWSSHYDYWDYSEFSALDLNCVWRAPAEACPMSIAVEAIASSAQFNHDVDAYQVWVSGNYVYGCTEKDIRDAIASRLRELADKEFPE